MDGWKTSFLLGRPFFRCYISFIMDVFVTCPSLGLLSDQISHTYPPNTRFGTPRFRQDWSDGFWWGFFCQAMLGYDQGHLQPQPLIVTWCCLDVAMKIWPLAVAYKTGICLIFFRDLGFGIYHPVNRRFGYFQGSFVQACFFFQQIQARTLSSTIMYSWLLSKLLLTPDNWYEEKQVLPQHGNNTWPHIAVYNHFCSYLFLCSVHLTYWNFNTIVLIARNGKRILYSPIWIISSQTLCFTNLL